MAASRMVRQRESEIQSSNQGSHHGENQTNILTAFSETSGQVCANSKKNARIYISVTSNIWIKTKIKNIKTLKLDYGD